MHRGSDHRPEAKAEAPERRGAGVKSRCGGYEKAIEDKAEQGLSAQRIYQDLASGHGFVGSYQSVKRFVAKLKAKEPKRVWRVESLPGEEAQMDFGLGAMIDGAEGCSKRSWVFRVVLSYSRKGYSEAVMRQDTETFLRCVEKERGRFLLRAFQKMFPENLRRSRMALSGVGRPSRWPRYAGDSRRDACSTAKAHGSERCPDRI